MREQDLRPSRSGILAPPLPPSMLLAPLLSSLPMNPYASHLGDRDPIEVAAATPRKLEGFLKTLGREGMEQSAAPGKWSAREIICHLADCELVFAFRLRQALAEQEHVIQPFDQDKWAQTYAAYDARAALAVFSSVRDWNLKFISAVPRQAFAKPLTHPERGKMTLQTVIETMSGHDLNHLKQLESIAARFAPAG